MGTITPHRPSRFWSCNLWRLAALAAAAGLLWATFRSVDLDRTRALLARSGPGIALVLLPYVLVMLLDSLGWRLLLSRLGRRVPYGALLTTRLSAEALVLTVPGGALASEAVVPPLLHRASAVPAPDALASMAARRCLLIATHALFLGLAVMVSTDMLGERAGPHVRGLLMAAAAAMMVAASLAVCLLARGSLAMGLQRLLRRVPIAAVRRRAWRAREAFRETDHRLRRVFRGRGVPLGVPLAAYGLTWVTESFETFLILWLLGSPLSWPQVAALEPATALLRAAAFVLPAGLGVQELGYVALLGALQIPQAASVAAALAVVKRSKEGFWALVGYGLLWRGLRARPAAAGKGPADARDDDEPMRAPRLLFICGSLNQTTQLHQIARELPEYEHAFTPYYADGWLEWARRRRLIEFTILGFKLRQRCLDYLRQHDLAMDLHGARGGYDLVVTCSDLIVPGNVRGGPLVVVQEGILDPPSLGLRLWRRFPRLPLWIAGTATTGLSGRYQRFCVASDGYREHFVGQGAPEARVVVTGIPNFDDCERYRRNDFPHRGYALVCSSDARETFKGDDRRAFVESALRIAAGRPLVFKLHPNENVRRATAEIGRWAPQAAVYASGSAEEMVANCDVLITQYSSLAFVGLALGKEVHSYFDLARLRRLAPVQNRSAARNIAAVCREVLATTPPAAARKRAAPAAMPPAVLAGSEAP